MGSGAAESRRSQIKDTASSDTAGHAHAWASATRCPGEHTRSVTKSVASREAKYDRKPSLHTNTWSTHSLTHMRDLMCGSCGSHCVCEALLSLVRSGGEWLVLPVCVRLLWRSAPRGVGVLRSCLPASLFEHLSMGLQSALSCPLWPLNHRMCVIGERLGYLRCLAQQQDVDISLAPPHLGTLLPVVRTVQRRNT